MRIVKLEAENFKRLRTVEITPDGNVITIGGKNGHGKSSVLDAIFVALKGRAVAPSTPVRKGEERAIIRLDMGEIIVTRIFIPKEGGEFTQQIRVESGEGLRYPEPQKVLDALLGEIGFDPFAFVNLKPKEQANRLLDMVPLSIDLDEYRELDASDFMKRTEVNRDVARLDANLSSIPEEEVPEEAPDRQALTDQLGNAANENTRIDRERMRREALNGDVGTCYSNRDSFRARAEDLRNQAAELDSKADLANSQGLEIEAEIAALEPLPEFVDTNALREQLREAETVLAAIDRQNRRKAIAEELAKARAASQALTDAMAQRAKERNAALAEAEMPVEGLAFVVDEKGDPVLTYEGLPFEKDQISTAVQLRVSTAIGMAANPRLRVLRISDGSLLDEDSMRMLAEMADTEDFQLFVEVVSTDGGVGFIMEDGAVVGGAQVEPAADAGNQDDSKTAKKGKAKPPADDKPEGTLV